MPNSSDVPKTSSFISHICAYFRDFLDTDFRRQRTPKRSIGLKDQRGNLTGIFIAKYPELVFDLCEALAKPTETAKGFTFTVGRGKYRSRISRDVMAVIDRHVTALEGEALANLGDQVKTTARELRERVQNDPETYREAVVTALRNGLVHTALKPLLLKLESSLNRQSNDTLEVAYDIEEELGARLLADAEEAIGSGLATAIVENRFDEVDAVIEDVLDVETIRRRIATYFETFRATSFFDELHELGSTLKLRENFEIYLYVGALHHNRVVYPLFYIPIDVSLEGSLFRITADRQIYVNKRAVEYAAQETARELDRPIPLTVKERILYLDDGDSFAEVMQSLIDHWCAELALKPPINLSSPVDQKAHRSQLAITNALHFAAFDKADESLLNDYEELMAFLGSDSGPAADFREIVSGFLSKDPVNVNAEIDRDWSSTPIEGRLVFQSPVPLNEEQRKILAALHHKNARFLSIEGPPGTGKSHTITAIVFQAILNGQNVLVLSDKPEALDVVEDKLNEVINSVRFDQDFQNPILRLGRSQSSYGRILTNQSIEAIKAHHRASSASEGKLATEIRDEENRVSDAIKMLTDQACKIKLKDVYEFHKCEDRVASALDDPERCVTNEAVFEALDAAASISNLFSSYNGRALKILRAVSRRVDLEDLEAFLQVQPAFAEVGMPSDADLLAMRLFSNFEIGDLETLHVFISEYQTARWPLVGHLFTRRRIRALNASLGSELAIVNALHAHLRVSELERAHAAFSKLSATLTRSGVPGDLHAILFQQAIEGLEPVPQETIPNLERIARIRFAIEQHPDIMNAVGLHRHSVDNWAQAASNAQAKRLREVMAYASRYKQIHDAFRDIPSVDYAGDKARLESLHAQRLAHTLDERVIDFAENTGIFQDRFETSSVKSNGSLAKCLQL